MLVDVVVIGGGVIGLAVAWRAAQQGMRVALADPAPGSGASQVAAGMLAPVGEAQFGERALLDLALESWRRYPAFVTELERVSGRSTGYRECGTLLVARDADDNVSLDREHHFRQAQGLQVERLTSRQCLRLEPGLAPSTRGGILAAGDHQVDPRRLVAALQAACGRAGVEIFRSRAALLSGPTGVAGVRTDDGREITAAAVVIAAGCWAALVEGLPAAVVPPIRPVKGQILRLSGGAAPPLAGRVIRGVDVYIVPRGDGSVVVGSTVEERGYDTTVTAGGVHQLLRDARELLPDIGELELVEASAGLRPGTPDNAPLLGRTAVPGLLMATGHYRNGVLLTPITADLTAALLAGRDAPPAAAGFAPDRFEKRARVPA
jgi:glycine oxidase